MAVDCTELEDFEKECLNNIGGVYQVIFNDSEELEVTKNEATNTITAVVNTTAFKSLTFRKGQANFTDPSAIDLVAGSSLITTTLQMNPPRRDATNTRAIKIMGQGQRYIDAFVKDGNGIWWYIPDLQLTTIGGGSGAAKPEGSKFELTMMNEIALEDFGYTISQELALGLLDAVS